MFETNSYPSAILLHAFIPSHSLISRETPFPAPHKTPRPQSLALTENMTDALSRCSWHTSPLSPLPLKYLQAH